MQLWRSKDTIPAYIRSGDTFCTLDLSLPDGTKADRCTRMYATLGSSVVSLAFPDRMTESGAELWGDSHNPHALFGIMPWLAIVNLDLLKYRLQEPSRSVSF